MQASLQAFAWAAASCLDVVGRWQFSQQKAAAAAGSVKLTYHLVQP
jgi:hypothetical protein